MTLRDIVIVAGIVAVPSLAFADDVTITMRALTASGIGREIGTIRAVDSKNGLMLVPRLSDLPPGSHGFHLHENPRCGNRAPDGQSGAGLAAGGHFDPDKTGRHEGPMGAGHKGDLPVLVVDDQGRARKAVVASKLTVADLWNHALIIHAGGDNYSDQPAALGGGGGRIACGTIVKAARRM